MHVAICLQTFGTAYRFHIQESKQSKGLNYTEAEPKSLKIIIPHPVKNYPHFIISEVPQNPITCLHSDSNPVRTLQYKSQILKLSLLSELPTKTLPSCVLHVLNISSSLIESLQYMTSSTNHEAFCCYLPLRFTYSHSTSLYSSNDSLNSSLNASDQV